MIKGLTWTGFNDKIRYWECFFNKAQSIVCIKDIYETKRENFIPVYYQFLPKRINLHKSGDSLKVDLCHANPLVIEVFQLTFKSFTDVAKVVAYVSLCLKALCSMCLPLQMFLAQDLNLMKSCSMLCVMCYLQSN